MSGDAKIIVLDGEYAGKNFPLKMGKFTIGRDTQADLMLRHNSISKIHVNAEVIDDSLVLNDAGSTNKIRFQQEKLEHAVIHTQEVFRLGEIHFRFDSGLPLEEQVRDLQIRISTLKTALSRKIVGQHQVIEQVIASVLANGHCLIVGVPGLAKTLLVKSISEILGLDFRRIQFTPDLMPSDITGSLILKENPQGQREFAFEKGPIFTQLLLADEINRTPPKTQAALLEAMQEKQVSASDKSHILPRPFLVMATQNPIDQEGTYPLPEAQLDRFMFNVIIDYPNAEEEEDILFRGLSEATQIPLKSLFEEKEILRFQQAVSQVKISRELISYTSQIVRATRPGVKLTTTLDSLNLASSFEYGAGPRAGQFILSAAQAFAAMQGRSEVRLDDIKKAVIPTLRHRIRLSFKAMSQGLKVEDELTRIINAVEVPEAPQFI